jgi:hypothetical protein
VVPESPGGASKARPQDTARMLSHSPCERSGVVRTPDGISVEQRFEAPRIATGCIARGGDGMTLSSPLEEFDFGARAWP